MSTKKLSLILTCPREKSAMTRKELARRTSLSWGCVSESLSDLISRMKHFLINRLDLPLTESKTLCRVTLRSLTSESVLLFYGAYAKRRER